MNRGQDGDHIYRGGGSLDPSAASCLPDRPLPPQADPVEADADTAFQVEVDRLAALIHDNDDDGDTA